MLKALLSGGKGEVNLEKTSNLVILHPALMGASQNSQKLSWSLWFSWEHLKRGKILIIIMALTQIIQLSMNYLTQQKMTLPIFSFSPSLLAWHGSSIINSIRISITPVNISICSSFNCPPPQLLPSCGHLASFVLSICLLLQILF